MAINRLPVTDTVTDGDQIPIGSTTNGDDRRTSIATLTAHIAGTLTASDDKVTQYAAPSSSGFSVAITNSSASIWLILTPTGGFAAGTLVLPAVGNAVDRQEVMVNSTQAVTTLTINGNGATVTGAPTTLAANGFFRLRFDDVANVWYRVG